MPKGPAWDDLIGIDGVGTVMAGSLVSAFAQERERASIDRLVAQLDVQEAERPTLRAARWRAKRWSLPARWKK